MKPPTHFSLHLYPLRGSGYRAFVGCRPVWAFWGHWINPLTYYRAVKYFCQRGYRGYADCDHWAMDSYLEQVMIGLLTDLKKYAHGFPDSLSEHDPQSRAIVDSERIEDYPGFIKWQAILSEIIEGLEASQELKNELTVPKGTYSEEPICWERVEGKEGFWQMKETDTPRFNKELHDQWSLPLKLKCLKAKALLARYWGSFWD